MYVSLKLAPETEQLIDETRKVLFSEYRFIAKGTIISKSLDMLDYDQVCWEKYIPRKGKLIASEPNRLNLTMHTDEVLKTMCENYRVTKTEAIHMLLSKAIAKKENHHNKQIKKLRVLSLNVNDFGGTESLEKFKKNRSYEEWDQMDKNEQMKAIFDYVCEKNADIVILQEYDEYSKEGKEFSQWMSEIYSCVPHSQHKRSSITIMFVKRGIQYSLMENPHNRNLRASLISTTMIDMDLCIYGVHIPYDDLKFWDELISFYEQISQRKEILIIGDFNVYKEGTNRKKKYDDLLKKGGADLWLDKGYPNDTSTYGESRLDYAVVSPKLNQVVKDVTISSELLCKRYTDHAALIVDICCP